MTMPHLTPVIDIEASGFGLSSYPIEIGLVLPNGATYCTLIKPHSSWTHWDADAENIHGISLAELQRKGKSVADVCDELNILCDGKVFYTDCWAHDYHWLCKLYAAVGKHCSFRLSPIEYLLSEQQMQNWAQKKKEYSKEANIKTHRALNDALIICEALDRELLANDFSLDAGRILDFPKTITDTQKLPHRLSASEGREMQQAQSHVQHNGPVLDTIRLKKTA